MSFPAFFDNVRTITVQDPLAEFLGAVENGIIEYRYADAVKVAGHSCPTVAGAYLMCAKAITRLYGADLPQRGGIRVAFRGEAGAGVTGVIANVTSLITGAAGEGGFKGIAGNFSRRNLLAFAADVPGELCFTRSDTGLCVCAQYRAERVPPAPEMGELFVSIQSGEASAEERAAFGRLWQDRVKRILIDHFDDAEMIVLTQS